MEKVKRAIGKFSDWLWSALFTLTVVLIGLVMIAGAGLIYLGCALGVLTVAAVIASWLASLVGLGAYWTVAFFFALILMLWCRWG